MSRHFGTYSLTVFTLSLAATASLGGCYNDAPIQLIRGAGGAPQVTASSGGAAIAPASGGTIAVGGTEATSGGAPGTGGEGLGGQGGMGPDPSACAADADCAAERPMCAMDDGADSGLCVECLADADCGDGECDVAVGECKATGGDGSGGGDGTGGSASDFDSLITNGDFSDGLTGWHGGDDNLDDEVDGEGCVGWGSVIGWDGGTDGISLEAGSYSFEFKLRTEDKDSEGDTKINIEVKIAKAIDPYEPVLLSQNMEDLGNSDEVKSFDFNVDETVADIGLAFFVGLNQDDGDQICIDDVVLKKN